MKLDVSFMSCYIHRCENGGICDPVSGACTCLSGYQGDHCESKVINGEGGKTCSVFQSAYDMSYTM